MVMYVGHVLSLLIYLAVILSAVHTAFTLRTTTIPNHYTWIPKTFIGCLIVQAALFLGIQIEWVASTAYNVGATMEEYTRLVYDLFNGFALITFATALNIYLGWKQRKQDVMRRYRRRREDHP